jgi:hypothetical protein
MTLYQFLQAQLYREDPVGDLARDAISDATFPRKVQTFESINSYFNGLSHGVCEGARESAKQACTELKECNRHLTPCARRVKQ